jgi:hypothetical protein
MKNENSFSGRLQDIQLVKSEAITIKTWIAAMEVEGDELWMW